MQGSKGAFLQLFDWKAKSRKKLFSNKSGYSDRSTHENKSEGRYSPLNLMDVSISVSNSVSDDESFVSKPAGVVARLMGLDSMPTFNFDDPCSSPFFDSQSLGEARESLKISHSVKKTPSRPIDKFQTEMLPPKSAKSIPLTHHKLLSPIKNPNFIPSKNAAHVMEAAARMIDSGPQASAKPKRSLLGSSVPLKVRDLKEKAEATQKVASRVRDSKQASESSIKPFKLADTYRRPVESNAAKYLKGESVHKSWDGPDTTSFEIFPDTGGSSVDLNNNNKGKSISLAIQAKVNVQRRESLGSGDSSRCLSSKKDQIEVKSSQTNTSQPNSRKSNHAPGVLTQNNQKQNRVVHKKNKLPSKPSVSHSQDNKHVSSNSSHGRHITSGVNSKSGSRKMGSGSPSDGNEVPYSSTKNLPRKKRIVDRAFHLEKNGDVDFELADKYEKRNNGSDVVSFTFTAPMTRTMPGSDRATSSLGFNVIGGDALSKLLEQKLREVTSRIESSCGSDTVESGSATTAASILQHLSPTSNQLSSSDAMLLRTEHKFQGLDASSSNHAEEKQLFDCRHPNRLSILEPTFSNESSNSSDSNKSNITEGNKHCSSFVVQAQEYLGSDSLRKFYSVEADTELSDSAASTSVTTVTRKDSMKSINWELEYVKEILCNFETVFNYFALGRVTETTNPRLFYQLENHKGVFGGDKGVSWPQRKVLFDCVGECLDIRCRRYVNGGFKAWAKGEVMVRRKDRLAAEVYKEISSLEKMGDCMVDELVDNDMSSQYGKWADFEVEAFELGVEIEGRILNSLINEMVADILRG